MCSSDLPEYQTTEAFNDMWCSALAHCQKRFEGKSDLYIEKDHQVDLDV